LNRFLCPRPYCNLIAASFADRISRAADAAGASWIAFNQAECAPIARELRSLQSGRHKLALLSHGIDSSDFVHNVRIQNGGQPVLGKREALWLGRQIFAEMQFHPAFDAIFCLSETDRHVEQWLGGTRVRVLPRVIEPNPLNWMPERGRIGTVSTLNHGPNYEGIERLCQALERQTPEIRLRIIGRPSDAGAEFGRKYPFVDYLGSLSDAALEEEARSWCAFVNPIFCYPRGCSTKLAVPLGWQIPIVTTRAGARGYVWDETRVPLLETAEEVADYAQRYADPAVAAKARANVQFIASISPSLLDVAEAMKAELTQIRNPPAP
jgi:hypothetical protein